MSNPTFLWRRFAGFAVLVLLLFVAAPTPACRSLHAELAPAEVVAAVENRTEVLQSAIAALKVGAMSDVDVAQVLDEDYRAWTFLRDKENLVTPADMKATLQSQAVAVKVAREKVLAGEYAPAEKIELLQALHDAWASLTAYYNPPAPTEPGV